MNAELLLDISRSQALKQCASAVRVIGLDISAVVGIAFAAFTIGILLTGALWFIHTRTGTVCSTSWTNIIYSQLYVDCHCEVVT